MTMKSGLFALLTSSLALGCLPTSKSLGGTGSDDDDSTNPGTDSDADSASGADPTASDSGEPGCADLEADAMAFVENHRSCQTSADCQLVHGPCYDGPGTDCGSVSLNGDADLEAWSVLHDELFACRAECGSPACGGLVVCNPSGLCEVTLDDVVCDLEAQVLSMLEPFGPDDVNCGTPRLDDPAQDWLAARDCVLDAQQSGTSFMLIHEVQGIDSSPSRALVGLQAFVYETVELFHDEGGLAPGSTTTSRACESFVLEANCAPEPGNLCLTCEAPGETELICDAPHDG
jgi:hypothetical protein